MVNRIFFITCIALTFCIYPDIYSQSRINRLVLSSDQAFDIIREYMANNNDGANIINDSVIQYPKQQWGDFYELYGIYSIKKISGQRHIVVFEKIQPNHKNTCHACYGKMLLFEIFTEHGNGEIIGGNVESLMEVDTIGCFGRLSGQISIVELSPMNVALLYEDLYYGQGEEHTTGMLFSVKDELYLKIYDYGYTNENAAPDARSYSSYNSILKYDTKKQVIYQFTTGIKQGKKFSRRKKYMYPESFTNNITFPILSSNHNPIELEQESLIDYPSPDEFIVTDQDYNEVVAKSLGELQRSVVYPKSAWSARIEGKVSLKLLIGTDGKPIASKTVVEESPSDLLTEAAMKAVHSFTFQPATQNGIPVFVWIVIPIVFRYR